jgi:uncharacterized membrane protein
MAPKLWCVAVLMAFWACGGEEAQPHGAVGGDAGQNANAGQPSLAGTHGEPTAGASEPRGGASQAAGGATESLAGAESSGAGQPAAGAASVEQCDPKACLNGGQCPAGDGAACECPDAFTGVVCELPRFELLKLPTDATLGVAVGVSADGAVVAGNVTTPAAHAGFRWTHAGGALLLDALPSQSGSSATALSADGKVIVGTSGAQLEAVYWSAGNGTPQSLLSAGWKSLQPLFVSADGSVIAGMGMLTGDKPAPFRWTKADGATALGTFNVANISVVGMSADGAVIVGNSGDATTTGFIWKSAGGLGTLTALVGDDHTNVLALSSDGSTVIGDSLQQAAKSRRVRWLTSTQPVLLDPLDPGTAWGCAGGPFTTCTTLSHDGSVIYTQRTAIAQRWTAAKGLEALPTLVNKFNCRAYAPDLTALGWIPGNCIGPPVAVIWDGQDKIGRVDAVLATFGVAAPELTNATISVVRAVSANGDTIVGDNFNTTAVWVARLLR